MPVLKFRSQDEVEKLLDELKEKVYDVDCDGELLKMKPDKVWVIKPPHIPIHTVMALFRCPDGRKVRMAVAKFIIV